MEEQGGRRPGRRRSLALPLTVGLLVAVAVALAALALQAGNNVSPLAGAQPPVPSGPQADPEVSPVGANFDWDDSVTQAADICGTWMASFPVGTGNMEVNRFVVRFGVVTSAGGRVLTAQLKTLHALPIPPAVYAACSKVIPAGSSVPGRTVDLPVTGGVVPLPVPIGSYNLTVLPPTTRTSGPVAYIWQISITVSPGTSEAPPYGAQVIPEMLTLAPTT
jgi:hypothetical protein